MADYVRTAAMRKKMSIAQKARYAAERGEGVIEKPKYVHSAATKAKIARGLKAHKAKRDYEQSLVEVRKAQQWASEPPALKPGRYSGKIVRVAAGKNGPEVTMESGKIALEYERLFPSVAPGMALAKETKSRRFCLNQTIDATGTSGTGIVAEGIQFSNGQVVIHWLSQLEAINVYANAVVLEQLHGHGGNTVVKWVDP